MTTCTAPGCSNNPVISWERDATPAELDALTTSGDLPPGYTGDVRLPMYGCDDHRVTDQLAAGIHQTTCTAPPSTGAPDYLCDCQPIYRPADPTPFA